MTRNEKLILFVAAGGHFFTHFAMLSFPALVMPLSRDLGISISAVVDISFWMYFLYGALAMLWGLLSDKLGHKPALGAGLLIAGGGFLTAGTAASIEILPLAFALVGIGCSSYHPTGTAIVSQGIRERGKALGINGIWGTVGMAVVPFAVGLFNLLFGWRGGLIAVGAFGIILGLASFFLSYEAPRQTDRMQTTSLPERTVRRLFPIFAVALIFGGFLFRSFTMSLPAFLEMRLGNLSARLQEAFGGAQSILADSAAFDTLTANLTATFIYVVGILGQWVGGRAADRFSLKYAYVSFFALGVPFLIGILLLPGAGMIAAAGVFVLFLLGMQPIENSLVAYLTPAKWRSVGYGLKFTLVFGAGSFSVKLLSRIEEWGGLERVMQVNLLYILIIVTAGLVFIRLSRGISFRHSHTEG
jgi:predicted MFS family arabinose efflux permease